MSDQISTAWNGVQLAKIVDKTMDIYLRRFHASPTKTRLSVHKWIFCFSSLYERFFLWIWCRNYIFLNFYSTSSVINNSVNYMYKYSNCSWHHNFSFFILQANSTVVDILLQVWGVLWPVFTDSGPPNFHVTHKFFRTARRFRKIHQFLSWSIVFHRLIQFHGVVAWQTREGLS